MAERQEKNNEADINEIVDNMTLMDDDFMNMVFDKNIPATRLVLRTILGRDDIDVISVDGQDEIQSSIVGGRKLRLDIVATDKSGVMSDIEVQRKKSGAHPRRARFHSSMLDARMLKASQEFTELADSHTIFITEKDYFGTGKPVYTIHRYVEEIEERFQDGSHIIYVNGEYNEDDAIGRLMSDFKCKNAKDMYYPELAEGVRYFKEEKGRDSMCELVEQYAEKYAKRYAGDIIAEKEKIVARNEHLEARNENLEAEVLRLREELAKLKVV